jgi:two-component system cell cycle sensor histidine kinase PleC
MSFKSVFKMKKSAPADEKAHKTALEHKADALNASRSNVARALFNAEGICIYADLQFNALHKSGTLEGTHLLDFIIVEDDAVIDARNAVSFDLSANAASNNNALKIENGIQNVSYYDRSRRQHDQTINYPNSLDFQTIPGERAQHYIIVSFPINGETSEGDSTNSEIPDAIQKIIAAANGSDKPAQAMRAIIADDDLNDKDVSVFLNMSHELMAIIHHDGAFRDINQTIHRNLGYSSEQLGAMNFIDLVHPDDRPHVHTILKSIISENIAQSDETEGQNGDTNTGNIITNNVIFFETRIVARDGETRWTEWKVQSTKDMLYTVGRDMTDAKRHEDELIRHQTQLSEAQEIGHMGHWRWEIGRNTVTWSEELFRIFGVTTDKFTPTLDSVNGLLERRDVNRMMQAFQRAMIEKNNYEMEFAIIRPDMQERSLKLQGRCELNEQGDVAYLFGVIQDVTERTNHERELRNAKDSAERAYAAKSQFLANMSHELRTPLNAIIGFSEMMQRQLLGPIGTEKYLDYVGGIRESGEHLLDLISDILDMSKIEAGKYELDIGDLNVAKVVRLSVHMMEGKASDVGVKVALDLKDEDIHLNGDRRAILQIMLNLLSNAVKFTREGGNIEVTCTKSDTEILVSVSDTGIGIPADKIDDITNPFEQAASHETRNHEGSGLGLAITKELVELHNGTLRIESVLGEGTTVNFTLPFLPLPAQE